jgi:hypothetical protein
MLDIIEFVKPYKFNDKSTKFPTRITLSNIFNPKHICTSDKNMEAGSPWLHFLLFCRLFIYLFLRENT